MTTAHADVESRVATVLAAQREQRDTAPRSARALRRAARRGRLLVAVDDAGAPLGWAVIEPCGRGVAELGALYVVPSARNGEALRALTQAGVAWAPRTVVVTMDPRFADWLVGEWGYERVSLWRATRASRGMFMIRRLAPARLAAAVRHASGATPLYLVREPTRTGHA